MSAKFLCVLIGFFFAFSAAYPLSIDSKDINKLKEGKVLLKPIRQNSVKGSHTAILINAPKEKVWKVLEEKENLPKFVSQIQEACILSENGDGQMVKTSVKICRFLPCFDYVLCFDNSQRYKRMSFQKTQGCFNQLFGDIELIPYENYTILECQVYADPGFYIPVFICGSLKSDIKNIMMAIKTEAEK